MKKAVVLAGAICLFVSAPLAAATSVIQNGSFETFTGGNPGTYVTLAVGNTQITEWTVIPGVNAGAGEDGGIDYIGTYWTASDGARSIDLDDYYAVGGVEQTFSTQPGCLYHVEFDLAGNPDRAPTVKWARVSAAGSSQDFSFDTTGKTRTNMGWVTCHWYFTATGETTTLKFQSLSSSGCAFGAALDNVTVSAVPEPITLASGFLAISGLGLYVRRRMKAPAATET